MTKDEAKVIFKRIASHYPKFIPDTDEFANFKFNEWYQSLKHYQLSDVSDRFDQHLKSEIYGQYEPKLAYLIKNCSRDDKPCAVDYSIICQYCNSEIPLNDYQKHIQRELAISYMKSREHLLLKTYKQKQLLEASDTVFDEYYNKFLAELYHRLESGSEKNRIYKLLDNPNGNQLTLGEFIDA